MVSEDFLLSPRFLKNGDIAIASVCPSGYLLLNHWMKSNQIWCGSCSHEWGAQQHFFFSPPPWGPGEGPKGQISINIIKFQLQNQFQRFLHQTLCVFSQMKDIKHIRRDFHLAAWVMLQGWDLGGWGAQWLSGRVLDSRPKGRGFEPHRRHCVVVLEQDTFILA